MRTSLIRLAACAVIACIALVPAKVLAVPLTAAQMYLDPSLIPPADYDYDFFSPGYTANFFNVQSLRVLPAFEPDGVTYYATPTVDYFGDITGSNGNITFLENGPYFVLATYVDNTSQLYDFGIQFQVHPETGPSYKWKKTETPAPDVVVSGPDVRGSDPMFGSGTTVKNDLTTWDEVTAYLKTLTNKHVELGGHGGKGKFYWNGTLVLDDNTQATKDWLMMMKGHVNNLTFMSCNTAAGAEGEQFLQSVANCLGASAGYTDVVGGNGKDWFINNDGVKRSFTQIPEPASVVLFILAMSLLPRSHRFRKSA